MKSSVAVRSPVGVPLTILGATPITAAAYVQLTASLPVPCSAIEVSNTTTKSIKLGIGGAGAEVTVYTIGPNVSGLIVPMELKKGVRVAVKAALADTTLGELNINFLA